LGKALQVTEEVKKSYPKFLGAKTLYQLGRAGEQYIVKKVAWGAENHEATFRRERRSRKIVLIWGEMRSAHTGEKEEKVRLHEGGTPGEKEIYVRQKPQGVDERRKCHGYKRNQNGGDGAQGRRGNKPTSMVKVSGGNLNRGVDKGSAKEKRGVCGGVVGGAEQLYKDDEEKGSI